MEKIMKTGKNPRGICCIVQDDRDMFVFPAEGKLGDVAIVDENQQVKTFNAHKS